MSFFSKIQNLLGAPENDFTLVVTDSEIRLTAPDGLATAMRWDDLETVSLLATPYSAIMPCIFWHLKSRTQTLDFPDRATGASEALKVIHNLENFDSLLYAQVMEGRYREPVVVWQKPPAPQSQRPDTLNTLEKIQEWHRSTCNGEWEHKFGLTISTLDNPGWSVAIDLANTPLSQKEFSPIVMGVGPDFHPSGKNWLVCRKEENQFRAFGDSGKLEEILLIFLHWKDTNT